MIIYSSNAIHVFRCLFTYVYVSWDERSTQWERKTLATLIDVHWIESFTFFLSLSHSLSLSLFISTSASSFTMFFGALGNNFVLYSIWVRNQNADIECGCNLLSTWCSIYDSPNCWYCFWISWFCWIHSCHRDILYTKLVARLQCKSNIWDSKYQRDILMQFIELLCIQ